jgi:hypothetical protein
MSTNQLKTGIQPIPEYLIQWTKSNSVPTSTSYYERLCNFRILSDFLFPHLPAPTSPKQHLAMKVTSISYAFPLRIREVPGYPDNLNAFTQSFLAKAALEP